MLTPPRTPPFQACSGGRLKWAQYTVRCALGHGGVVEALDKREGDGATPLGAWPMRRVFYRPDRVGRPQTRILVSALTPQIAWCDDPKSPEYNRQVRLPFQARHEMLWREDHVYDLVVELGFNDDPVIPGRGSAVFLHLARPRFPPTQGCIACALPDLLELLKTARSGDALAVVR